MFIADLHIHSRFSRACSKDCDIEHLSAGALRKGISVLGTGDFTHPAWAAELRETLVPAEPGLFRIRPELERRLVRDTPPACAGTVRFMLSVEISTIYRRAERTRKVHHLIYAPSFDAADRITAALAKVGNLASDGRPILGLDSRDLLDITLSADPDCFLVPAHVWTPWFAVLGSKSGFDAIGDCYADLAGHIFAVETGLSSDPPMNWTCSSLDRYRLVSNSDAHSPPMLGREATVFGTDVDYFAMAAALRTGDGLDGTLEFFPEEGKYHLDGHRKCGIRVDPEQARDLDTACPRCGKPLTVGVLHRVAELADRPAGFRPPGTAGYTCLVQLPEIMGEILATGPRSKKVAAEIGRLVATLGPELSILREIPLDDLRRVGGSRFSEGIGRLRRGEVIRDAGYDGEYGTIRLFGPDELDGAALFSVTGLHSPVVDSAERSTVPRAANRPAPRRHDAAPAAPGPAAAGPAPVTGSLLDGLDPDQRAAATADGPLLIIAGPGTGKTRTLTHRIAHQVAERGVPARHILAITFTRRAAQEMRDRLAVLCPGRDDELTVTTFHGLGLRILREHHDAAGLPPRFAVADEAARLRVAAELTGSEPAGRKLIAGLDEDPDGAAALRKELIAHDLVDFDGLVAMAADLLRCHPAVAAALRARWPRISVDEYQDIDAVQYDLLRMISGDGAGMTAIGDPDQAVYGFRGADVGIFGRFAADFPGATTVQLARNYRSDPAIVTAATQAIAPGTLVPGRTAIAVREAPPADPGDMLGAVTLHEAVDEHAEAAWIAAMIDALLGGASFHALDSGRADGHAHGKLGLADIAVLYRTDAQAGPLGQALTRAGLPFQKRSHDLLVRRTGVADIMREMRLLEDPDPDVRQQVTAAVRALARARGEGDATVIDIRAAGELLAPLARRCGADAERFRAEIVLGAETDALDPRAEAITLLTLHGAKGLEFDVVFLAGCENGLLPLRLPGSGPIATVDAAEERRLLFVGMTRARGKLLLSCAARRIRQGAETPASRSPFLAAIDPALLGRAAPRRARRTADRQMRLL
jgi:DNA helicase II / ATP-dependent DNA helicase PcrA